MAARTDGPEQSMPPETAIEDAPESVHPTDRTRSKQAERAKFEFDDEDATDPEAEIDGDPVIDAARRSVIPLQNDAPIEFDDEDHLGFVQYADALHELFDNPATQTPLTIAVSAPWGTGKSSLGRLLERRLTSRSRRIDSDSGHIVSWFNAWQHQDARVPAAALSAAVAEDLIEHQPWWRRLPMLVFSPLSPSSGRLRARALLALAAIAVVVVVVVAEWDRIAPPGGDVAAIGVTGGVLGLVAGVGSLVGHATQLMRFVRRPDDVVAHGEVAAVRRRLGALVSGASHTRSKSKRDRRVVVVIDDLDRIPPARALSFIEATILLLNHPGVIVVLLVDGQALEQFAGTKTISERADGDPVGRAQAGEFIRKLVQLVFEIPPSSPDVAAALLLTNERRERRDQAQTEPAAQPPAGRPADIVDRRALFDLLRWRSPSSRTLRTEAIRLPLITLGLLVVTAGLTVIPVVGVPLAVVALLAALIAGLATVAVLPQAALRDLMLLSRLRRVDHLLPDHIQRLVGDEEFTSALRDADVRRLKSESALPTADVQREIRSSAGGYLRAGFDAIMTDRSAKVARSCVASATPRDLVRIRNRMRLTHAIAMRRGLISGDAADDDGIAAAAIAKWCVLIESATPEVRQALLRGTLHELPDSTVPAPRGRIDRAGAIDMLEERPVIDDATYDQLVLMQPA